MGQVVRQTWTEGTLDHVMDFIYDNNGSPYAMKYEKDLVYAQFASPTGRKYPQKLIFPDALSYESFIIRYYHPNF